MAPETLTIHFPKDDKVLLEQFAKERDLSFSQVVRKALREFMLRENIK